MKWINRNQQKKRITDVVSRKEADKETELEREKSRCKGSESGGQTNKTEDGTEPLWSKRIDQSDDKTTQSVEITMI